VVGPADVAVDLGAIVATAAVAKFTGNLAGTVAAVLYIGVRQRHLSNLAHECVHAKIVRSAPVNKALGYFLTAILGEGFEPYRISHQVHHAKLGATGDPMFESYLSRSVSAPTPSKTSFVWRVIVLKVLWTLPKSSLVAFVTKAPTESSRSAVGRALFWFTLAAAAWRAGVLGDLVVYWLLPLLLVRPAVTWITDLGNHAGVIDTGDPITQTRGWSSHWLTRHLLGGHLDDMFHPVHHWCPRIPWRRLPQAAAILQTEFDRWPEVPWCSGYFFRRNSTPDIPCVIEDIITRLHDHQTPNVSASAVRNEGLRPSPSREL